MNLHRSHQNTLQVGSEASKAQGTRLFAELRANAAVVACRKHLLKATP